MDDDKKHSPDNTPPGTVGAGGPARDVLPPGNIMPHVQMIGRGKRAVPNFEGGKLPFNDAQSSHVIDYAGSRTGRFAAKDPAEINKPSTGQTAPKLADPSLVEQLARRLETYAGDQRAMSKRAKGVTEHRRRMADAAIYQSSANALREAMTPENIAEFQTEVMSVLLRNLGKSYDKVAAEIVKLFMR